jgi:glyoxylase-like metal-dependent hydrolase (beta-lactamase superfamily II)
MTENTSYDPEIGVAIQLEPELVLIVAPNASPMTFRGTNTYVIGTTSLAVIDPGPLSDTHLAALLQVIGDRPVSHIALTHSHLDHSPLAAKLAQVTGATIVGYGDSHAGRSAVMQRLAQAGYAGGGEGMDWSYQPDQTLADGETLSGEGWTLAAIHTPGHIGNHLCLQWGDAIFTGDHVMGWATSLVSPPDGDMTDFMASCERLQNHPARVYYPGHGAPVTDPLARLATLIDHRKHRSAQIITALRNTGSADITTLTKQIYADVAPALLPAAARNVFAHLIDLHETGHVSANPTLSPHAEYSLISSRSDEIERK